MHNARSALEMSQCGSAIAAGVNLTLTPDTPASFQLAGTFHNHVKMYNFPSYALIKIHSHDGATFEIRPASGMLSSEGRCKTLDASADGYVRAEACGVLLLERLDFGQGHHRTMPPPGVLALLAGTAVNQDGRSSSLTAPNGPAQQRVIRDAIGAAGVMSHAIKILQMHGTGERR